MKHVWVIEEGEYEQRQVVDVATSPAAAVRAIKAAHPTPPYEVEWAEIEDLGDGHYQLVGHFEQVLGWSTAHTARFDITRHELVGDTP